MLGVVQNRHHLLISTESTNLRGGGTETNTPVYYFFKLMLIYLCNICSIKINAVGRRRIVVQLLEANQISVKFTAK